MAYIKPSSLSKQAFQKSFSLNESFGRSKQQSKTVFISYSHKDKEYVKPIASILNSLGVSIYVDYLDDQLNGIPNEQAAKILREKIKTSHKFISIVTPNSISSKWMPWELGLGDGTIRYENVAILPLAEITSFGEQEYAALYGRVEKIGNYFPDSFNDYLIIYPDRSQVKLVDWLNK